MTGKNLTQAVQITDRWKGYCEDLYHDKERKGIELGLLGARASTTSFRGCSCHPSDSKSQSHRYLEWPALLVWPVATYGCESWTLRKNEETCLDAFEMKGLRKILRVSWTAKKTNEWVLNKAGVKRELLDTVKARKLGSTPNWCYLHHLNP